MTSWKKYYNQYKEPVLYLIFGGLTTLTNFLSYFLLAHVLRLPTVAATIAAWVLSVLFAYVTNKRWVFESRRRHWGALLREAAAFFACRAFSGLLDVLIMWVCVDWLHWNDLVVKIASNVLVIVLNYLFSKLWIFKKENNGDKGVSQNYGHCTESVAAGGHHAADHGGRDDRLPDQADFQGGA